MNGICEDQEGSPCGWSLGSMEKEEMGGVGYRSRECRALERVRCVD